MTHKQQCAAICAQHLQDRELQSVFSHADFEQYYRKHNGYNSNAYLFGIHAADYMIFNQNINILNQYTHDTGNES